MAHLWRWRVGGQLVETRLAAERAPLEREVETAGGLAGPRVPSPSAWIEQAPDGPWVLISPSGVRASVNGDHVVAGIRVLDNRDEIRTPDGVWFFSTEEIARVEPFPDIDHVLRCARCTRPLECGTPAVRCPNPDCGRWHHETEAFPCWTSIAFCAVCSRATGLGPDDRWVPEEA